LSNAHSLLLGSSWTGAEVAAIARSQLDPYRSSDNPDRLRIEGDPVTLPADLATPFGLVLHELATNAAKHGALSRPGGSVRLSWSMTSRNNTPALTVIWSETGGPPVQPPKTSGFGGVLIENGLPHAVVGREFRPEGLVCTMEIPLPEASENGAVGQT
jgi:two-component system CheB/CheR fusion protein